MSKFDDMKAGKIPYSRTNINEVFGSVVYKTVDAVDFLTAWYNNTIEDGCYLVRGLIGGGTQSIQQNGVYEYDTLEAYLESGIIGEGLVAQINVYHLDDMTYIKEYDLIPWNLVS